MKIPLGGLFHFWKPKTPKLLGVLLCYNDADILEDVIRYLLTNGHSVIAWDHGSDDGTKEVLDNFESELIERQYIPRSFDFYQLYQRMSEHLIRNYIRKFDWISWPDQDEVLEGLDRSRSYQEWIECVYQARYDYIQFNNFNFWFTEEDDPSIKSPTERIRNYSLFPDCSPRIRSWRASKTNVRHFNHNPLNGSKYPENFNLRHYPMRTHEQMMRRLNKDRAALQRGGENYHYNNMKEREERLLLKPEQLHYDDGKSELNPEIIYNWREIYGYEAKS